MVTLDEVLAKAVSNNPNLHRESIIHAYEYACDAHKGQYRLSGDPYISHSLAVADILLSLNPDEDAIVTALLHGVADTPHYDITEIEEQFGPSVARLLSAYVTLIKIKSLNKKTDTENLRKMFLVMAQDLRVVLIRLSDRLHNMHTLDFQTLSERKKIARETLDIYVPISARLGIYNMKVQLEDLCFKYLYKEQYEDLRVQLHDYLSVRGKNIDEIKKELTLFLKQHSIKAHIEGRVKNLYSIYKKLKLKTHTTLSDIYDIFAMRVVLPTRYLPKKDKEAVDHLYAVLGLIHGKWRPAPNRFKDYIAVPKPNGYKSLHTAVFGLSPKSFYHPTEIQIRSQKMHEQAEYGIASHWIYEDTKRTLAKRGKNQADDSFKKNADWLSALSKMYVDMRNGKDLVNALKLDVFTDRIFVLTPTGQVKDLPHGSTPVDFAYSVHTDVGHRCQLAKVNGSVVPLDYELKNGEVVEIIQKSKPEPKLHWLSFVKTAGAKAKIRSYLRALDKEKSFRDGKEIINKILKRLHKPPLDDELSLFRHYGAKKYSLKDRVTLVEEIGNGALFAGPVLKKVFGSSLPLLEGKTLPVPEEKGVTVLPKAKVETKQKNEEIFIAGEKGVPYRLANCCKPSLLQPITGYVTRGNAVSIHLQNCKLLSNAAQERMIDAHWGMGRNARTYAVKVLLKARNRVGLIRDIANVITSSNVHIVEFGTETRSNRDIQREIVLEVTDNDQFRTVLESLQSVRNVFEVAKTSF